MTSLELDHVFCFCTPDLPEASIVEKYGFELNKGRHHTGQGTANRCVVFQKNYLELIYLESKEEAENNPLRLDRRAQWQQTGASPFGIALRGSLSQEDRKHFWDYHPSYMPSGSIPVLKSNGDNQPLIFVVPSSPFPAHPMDARKIAEVRLRGPSYDWPLAFTVSNVCFGHGEDHQMQIVLGGNQKESIRINELLSITK